MLFFSYEKSNGYSFNQMFRGVGVSSAVTTLTIPRRDAVLKIAPQQTMVVVMA